MKPVVVEAEQYFSYLPEPQGVCFCHIQQHRLAHVHTPKGLELIQSGDWILTNDERGQYPCAPATFESLYEPLKPARQSEQR
jgi:hypothetical protein